MRMPRDPYEAPPAPRERGGPVLRFAIVAALLAAAAWGYMTYAQGPTLTDSKQQEQSLADAGGAPGYAAPPEAALAPTPDPQSAPAARAAPAPATEAVPPPSTTTAPPSSGG